MANILTGIRIICGILILVFPAFSKWYYALYLLAGITDAVDGTVARKLGQASDFGAKFDTIADFIFAIAVLTKIFSSLYVPVWMIICIAMITAIKLFNLTLGYIKHKTIVAVHSILNKCCGVVVFLIPLFIGLNCAWQAKFIVIIFGCVFAFIAAIVECFSIFQIKEE